MSDSPTTVDQHLFASRMEVEMAWPHLTDDERIKVTALLDRLELVRDQLSAIARRVNGDR